MASFRPALTETPQRPTGRTGIARSIPDRALASSMSGSPCQGPGSGLPPPISNVMPGTPPRPTGSARLRPSRPVYTTITLGNSCHRQWGGNHRRAHRRDDLLSFDDKRLAGLDTGPAQRGMHDARHTAACGRVRAPKSRSATRLLRTSTSSTARPAGMTAVHRHGIGTACGHERTKLERVAVAMRDERRRALRSFQSRSDALTGIIGARRARTVSMISALSMPWR